MIEETGAMIEVVRIAEIALMAAPVDRFAVLLMACRHACLQALQSDGWDNLETGDEPFGALAHASAAAPAEAVAAARRWAYS